jgi:hypothetical protein
VLVVACSGLNHRQKWIFWGISFGHFSGHFWTFNDFFDYFGHLWTFLEFLLSIQPTAVCGGGLEPRWRWRRSLLIDLEVVVLTNLTKVSLNYAKSESHLHISQYGEKPATFMGTTEILGLTTLPPPPTTTTS